MFVCLHQTKKKKKSFNQSIWFECAPGLDSKTQFSPSLSLSPARAPSFIYSPILSPYVCFHQYSNIPLPIHPLSYIPPPLTHSFTPSLYFFLSLSLSHFISNRKKKFHHHKTSFQSNTRSFVLLFHYTSPFLFLFFQFYIIASHCNSWNLFFLYLIYSFHLIFFFLFIF